MEKFQPVEIDFVINNDELKQDTAKAKADIESVGQTGDETAAKVNAQINSAFKGSASEVNAANAALVKQNQIVKQGKPQWNGLGNSINQISREASAFTVSAQTGFLAISNNLPILADEIGRVAAKNKELKASGEKTVPVWKQVAKGIFSWGTALSLGVTLLTIYGKEVVTWIGSLVKGKNAVDELKESQNALSAAYNSSDFSKAIKNVLTLGATFKSAKEGVVDKEKALKDYNETLGDVLGKTNEFSVAEDNLNKKTPAYVKAMLYRAAATAAAAEAAKQLVEDQIEINKITVKLNDLEKEDTSGATSSAVFGYGPLRENKDINLAATDIVTEKLDKKKEEVKEKTKDFQQIIIDFQTKLEKIVKEGGLNLDEETPDGNKSTVSSYQSLLDKLSALDKEYSRKSFTKDEEELQALKDKFESVKTLVQRFNADPKNKAQLIDLSNLDQLEQKATESLTYRQTTDKLEEDFNTQKKLFADYETYKKQFGEAAAEEEFAGKIEEATNYYDYLKQQKKTNETAFKAVEEGTATGGEIERVQLINKQLKEASASQDKLFNEQLASLINYQKKRQLLIEQYEADRSKLVEAGRTDEVEELDKQHQAELNALDDVNLKKLASYKELFKGIVGLTAKEAKTVIADAKAMIATQEMSAEMLTAIQKKIAETEKLLASTKLDDIYKYASAIGSLSESLSDLGTELGSSSLANSGALLSGLSGSISEILTAFDSDASSTDKITAGISSAIKLVTVFTQAAASRKAAEEEYYLSVIGFQNDYNLSLQEQIRLRSILNENVFITDYEGRIKDALEGLGAANEEYQIALDNLIDNGKAKDGQRNAVDWGSVGSAASAGAGIGAVVGSVVPVIGNVIGAIGGALVGAIGGLFATKKEDTYTDILTEYPELIEESENGILRINQALAESLVANDLVNAETALILENILAWEEALEAARDQIKEVITELTGDLGTDLKDVLVDAFVSGENAAIKMGDTIEAVLENVLSSLIFNSVFSQAFDDLEEQMTNSFDVGGDGTWVDDFSQFFNEANGLTDDFNKALEAAQAEADNFGFDIFQPDSTSSSGLTGSISSELTEETGSELAGLFRGQYDVTKRLFEASEAYFEREEQCNSTMLALVAINTKIEVNTRNTVTQLELHLTQLQTIAANTKQSQSSRDLGVTIP